MTNQQDTALLPVTDEALKPCPNPWCESHDYEHGEPTADKDVWSISDTIVERFRVHCAYCNMHGPAAGSESEAIAAWNTRAEQAKPSASCEAGEVERVAIVLVSEDFNEYGYQLHGLFASFDDALAHVRKDAAIPDLSWATAEAHEQELVVENTRWVASAQPIRAAITALRANAPEAQAGERS